MLAKEWCELLARRKRKTIDAIGDDGGNCRRDDDVRFQIRVTIQNFPSKQCPRQRSPKNRSDAGPHARREHNPPVARIQFELRPEKRAEAGSDLRNRSFSPPRTASSDRNR